ncbi:hypothetical protein [Rubrolithibacter danxiaensis]|uniref:hypothetical protein n=1 Tax=Rubrolithibacter danxiaensis TaxID=3390805 RepID=UPI003BF8136B
MKILIGSILISTLLMSCGANTEKSSANGTASTNPLTGTWKLLQGTLIENGDTTVTDYTKNVSFIKIINDTHFAFLQHDLNKGKDSSAAFSAGGGTYSLTDTLYKEHLEYCSAREWEGNDFSFTISFSGDTLIQQGVEKIESKGINRLNIEKYVKVK